jgi:hypothetical protein
MRQLGNGEDCLKAQPEFRSRPNAALRPKETSGSGVAFSLVSFFWLSKRKKLA